MEEELQMRELTSADLFPMLAIIGKLDVKDSIIAMFNGEDDDDDEFKKATKDMTAEEIVVYQEKKSEERGKALAAELLQKVFQNLVNVKDDINKLLASLTGKKFTEINSMSLDDYALLLVEFAKKPELITFFKSMGRLM